MSNLYFINANISGRAMWHLVYDKQPGLYFIEEDFEEEEYDIEAYREEFIHNEVVEVPDIAELKAMYMTRLIEGLPPNREQKEETEKLRKELLIALNEIEKWKNATGLEDSRGDPDGITPEDLRDEINHLRQQQEKNWGAADEAIRGQYEDRIKAERSVCVKFLRDCAKSKRDYANRLLSDTMQSKPQADVYERESATLESVAEVIENGKHWK
jgi:hypothetical protein